MDWTVAEVRALLDAATPGPWRAEGVPRGPQRVYSEHRQVAMACGWTDVEEENNAALIAAAPDALRWALDRLAGEEVKLRDAFRAGAAWCAYIGSDSTAPPDEDATVRRLMEGAP